MPTSIWKLLNWFCVVVLVGAAALYSLGLGAELVEGRIMSAGKGSKRTFLLAAQPYAFFSNLVMHLLVNGLIWYGAYWIWSTNIRDKDQ